MPVHYVKYVNSEENGNLLDKNYFIYNIFPLKKRHEVENWNYASLKQHVPLLHGILESSCSQQCTSEAASVRVSGQEL